VGSDAQAVSTNSYDAFGNLNDKSGDSDNNRLANTKERTASIGLDNHGFRYYNPVTGRYISRDPAGYPEGLNNYLYVLNNPINRIDPLGLWSFWGAVDSVLGVAESVGNVAYGAIDSVSMGLASAVTSKVYGQDVTDNIQNSTEYKVGEVLSYVDPKTAAKNIVKAAVKAGVEYAADEALQAAAGEVDGLNEAGMLLQARRSGRATKAAVNGKTGPGISPEPAMDPKARGRKNEKKVLDDIGENKNTKKESTSHGDTIPDFENNKQVGDIKDTKKASDTKQMKAQREVAEKSGREHVVITGQKTKVSKPLGEKSTIIRRDDIGPQ